MTQIMSSHHIVLNRLDIFLLEQQQQKNNVNELAEAKSTRLYRKCLSDSEYRFFVGLIHDFSVVFFKILFTFYFLFITLVEGFRKDIF